MREKQVEQYLIKQVKMLGGLCYKWSSPGQRGVPDRIVFLFGEIHFVEVKTKGGKLSRLQELTIEELKKRGCNVHIVWSKEDVDGFCQACCAEYDQEYQV